MKFSKPHIFDQHINNTDSKSSTTQLFRLRRTKGIRQSDYDRFSSDKTRTHLSEKNVQLRISETWWSSYSSAAFSERVYLEKEIRNDSRTKTWCEVLNKNALRVARGRGISGLLPETRGLPATRLKKSQDFYRLQLILLGLGSTKKENFQDGGQWGTRL